MKDFEHCVIGEVFYHCRTGRLRFCHRRGHACRHVRKPKKQERRLLWQDEFGTELNPRFHFLRIDELCRDRYNYWSRRFTPLSLSLLFIVLSYYVSVVFGVSEVYLWRNRIASSLSPTSTRMGFCLRVTKDFHLYTLRLSRYKSQSRRSRNLQPVIRRCLPPQRHRRSEINAYFRGRTHSQLISRGEFVRETSLTNMMCIVEETDTRRFFARRTDGRRTRKNTTASCVKERGLCGV